jgi:hypothetical protein
MWSRRLYLAVLLAFAMTAGQAFCQTVPTVGGAGNAVGNAVNGVANGANVVTNPAVNTAPNAAGAINSAATMPPAPNVQVQGGAQAGAPNRAAQTTPRIGTQGIVQSSVGAQSGVGTTATMFNDNRPEQWRYKQDNGRWWYWTPDNRWMWYDSGNWTYYEEPSAGVATTYQTAPYTTFYSQSAPYTTNYGGYTYSPGYGYGGYGYGGYPYYRGYYRGYSGYYGNGYYGGYGGYGYRNGISIGAGGVGTGIGGRR